MNICKNCNSIIKDGLNYCDILCHMGYINRMYAKFQNEFKRELTYYEL